MCMEKQISLLQAFYFSALFFVSYCILIGKKNGFYSGKGLRVPFLSDNPDYTY